MKWNWSADCEEAFQKAKGVSTCFGSLRSATASTTGWRCLCLWYGAAISRVYPDGSEQLIACHCASRTFTKSEKNYAQIEKEAHSLVFGVQKFHQYLYGLKFTLYTDHKPLTTLLGERRAGIPPLTCSQDITLRI